MQLFFKTLTLGASLSAASYQADAPVGRWYGSDTPPKQPRSVPGDAQVACPKEFDFCIDYRWSDAQTCLHPNPHLIKRCLDLGCIESPFGKARAAAFQEDTYCKDFMSKEGRYCQWTEQYMCRCPPEIEDLVYANGVVIRGGQAIPDGYRIVKPCIYPTGNMKRMQNGAYVDVPVPGGEIPPPMPDDPKLKGDPHWVDPRGEPIDPALRNPNFAADDANKHMSVPTCVSAMIFAVVAVLIL